MYCETCNSNEWVAVTDYKNNLYGYKCMECLGFYGIDYLYKKYGSDVYE